MRKVLHTELTNTLVWPTNPPPNLFTTMTYSAQGKFKHEHLKKLQKTPEELEEMRQKKNLASRTHMRKKRDKKKAQTAKEKQERHDAAYETAQVVVNADPRHRMFRDLPQQLRFGTEPPGGTPSTESGVSSVKRSTPKHELSKSSDEQMEDSDANSEGSMHSDPISFATSSQARSPAATVMNTEADMQRVGALSDEVLAKAHNELIEAGQLPKETAGGVIEQLLSLLRNTKRMAANAVVNSAMKQEKPRKRRARAASVSGDSQLCSDFETPPTTSDDDDNDRDTKTATRTATKVYMQAYVCLCCSDCMHLMLLITQTNCTVSSLFQCQMNIFLHNMYISA